MYARVTTGTTKLDKFDDMTKIYQNSVLPAAKKQKGFKGFYMFGDRKTGKGMTIALWNTEADMMAGESSSYYRDQVAKVMPYLTSQPIMEHYEVGVKG